MEASDVDVVIIGAGLSGIAFARFYLDTHPTCRLTILEKDSYIGGVWGSDRVFDAFWVQSPLRMTSFSDVVLEIPKDAPNLHDTFEAKYVTQYLESYVDSHIYNGTSLRDRIQLNSEVRSIKKIAGGWMLQIDGKIPYSLRCVKLAVASGLTSMPRMPDFPRSQDWTLPVLHHRDFGKASQEILDSTTYQDITVLGGGKSAADMVYASVKAGKNVNWVIRKNGEGPGIFMNPAASGRYRNNAEAGATQRATRFSPSSFHPLSWWVRLLHWSRLGKSFLERRLFASDIRYKAWANYRGREGALPGFRDLEPDASFFWTNGPIGMIQHDDFWDLVSKNVHIYRGDVIGMKSNCLVLNGDQHGNQEVPSDVVLCGTGWITEYPFFSPELATKLGLPHDPSYEDAEELQTWSNLMTKADRQILARFPILAKPPPCKPISDASITPARLYNGIASLTETSIVFLGRARMSNNFRGAEAQAIWATAYWDGYAKLPPSKIAQKEVAYMNAFSRRRYPSRGLDGVNFHADLVRYTDKLISEAGLMSHRKGWWKDQDEPCLASDFKDCKDEYLRNVHLRK